MSQGGAKIGGGRDHFVGYAVDRRGVLGNCNSRIDQRSPPVDDCVAVDQHAADLDDVVARGAETRRFDVNDGVALDFHECIVPEPFARRMAADHCILIPCPYL